MSALNKVHLHTLIFFGVFVLILATDCFVPKIPIIPHPHEIIDEPWIITEPGVYTLTSDIEAKGTAILINADNVTIDGNNHLIRFATSATNNGPFLTFNLYGIRSTGNNTEIRNCRIINAGTDYTASSDFGYRGISCYPGTNAFIHDNVIEIPNAYFSMGIHINQGRIYRNRIRLWHMELSRINPYQGGGNFASEAIKAQHDSEIENNIVRCFNTTCVQVGNSTEISYRHNEHNTIHHNIFELTKDVTFSRSMGIWAVDGQQSDYCNVDYNVIILHKPSANEDTIMGSSVGLFDTIPDANGGHCSFSYNVVYSEGSYAPARGIYSIGMSNVIEHNTIRMKGDGSRWAMYCRTSGDSSFSYNTLVGQYGFGGCSAYPIRDTVISNNYIEGVFGVVISRSCNPSVPPSPFTGTQFVQNTIVGLNEAFQNYDSAIPTEWINNSTVLVNGGDPIVVSNEITLRIRDSSAHPIVDALVYITDSRNRLDFAGFTDENGEINCLTDEQILVNGQTILEFNPLTITVINDWQTYTSEAIVNTDQTIDVTIN